MTAEEEKILKGTSKAQTQGVNFGKNAEGMQNQGEGMQTQGMVAGGTNKAKGSGTEDWITRQKAIDAANGVPEQNYEAIQPFDPTEGYMTDEEKAELNGTKEPEIPPAIKAVAEKAQQQAAKLLKEREAQRIWEPTREAIKRTGLNFPSYLAEARKAGANVNAMEVASHFYGQDPSKSIEEGEKAAKREKARENMNLIGNALMHAGNFFGSLRGGHGAVKLEDPVQFTERQRKLKQQGEELNRSRWKDVLDNYKAQQADERAQRTADLNEKRLAEQQAYHDKLAAIAAGKADNAAKAKEEELKLKAEGLEHKKTTDNRKLDQGDKKIKQGQQRTDAYVYGQHNKGTGGRSGGSGGSGRGGSGGKNKWLGSDGNFYPNIQSAVATFPDGYKPKGDIVNGGIDSKSLNAAYDKYHRSVTYNRNRGGNRSHSQSGGQKSQSAVSKLGIRKNK